ncbi:translation initiation factor IF-5A [Candidatus Woesearchaeota archaeon]|nr:translation initiation factor IF-5A [Candidatus Woesearchaeota archaeon]
MAELTNTKKVSVGTLKEGSFVVVDGAACKVVDIQVSRPGKHGHAKIRLTAVGLLDDKKRVEVMPGHDNVDVPIIDKRTAQVLSITVDKAEVMDSETYETFSMDIPDDLKGQCTEGCNVLYWVVLDQRVMKQIKTE